MKNKLISKILVLFISIAVVAFLLTDNTLFLKKPKSVTYKQFISMLESGSITNAKLEDNSISFEASGVWYSTNNPGNEIILERLLLNDVEIKTYSEATLNSVLDLIYDLIFFGAVAFGLFKLFLYSHQTFKIVHKTGIKFNDIAGMDSIKKDMMFLTEVLKSSKAYSQKGIRPVKGVILEGPPGNGKTMFAKALASETNINFIAAKGADFQSAMMSIGARKVKMLFNKARRNKPCIIFIDEFDSIGERRNYAGSGIDKENNRMITTMLNEMDGFSPNNGILVIAATNSYASLDPALIRSGRFDIKISIGNPDRETRKKLIEIYTRKKSLADSISTDSLLSATEGLSCAAIETLLNEAATIANMDGRTVIEFNDIVIAAQNTGVKFKSQLYQVH